MVTRCSCIASRSAACVLGGVRLISSARTMLLKIGPGAKTICRLPVDVSSWMMSVPVMSEGIRSGVNWMRVNFSSSTCARVWISNVLASPGTPTMRLLPPTKSVFSTSSMTSCWPMILLCSSARTALRPLFILSASAMSSGESRSTMLGVIVLSSMGHRVNDVVDSELVGFVCIADGREARVRELPVLRDVVVVVRDRDQAFGRVVVLEHPEVDRTEAAIIWWLELLRSRNLEERMEDGVRAVELDPPTFGQHVAHLRREIAPAAAIFGEIVEDDEPPLLEVGAEARRLRLGQRPEPGLGHIGDGMPEQLGIVERVDVGLLDVGREQRHLVHDLHEVALAGRVVGR